MKINQGNIDEHFLGCVMNMCLKQLVVYSSEQEHLLLSLRLLEGIKLNFDKATNCIMTKLHIALTLQFAAAYFSRAEA